MIAAPYQAEAERISDNITGGQDGERFLNRLGKEFLGVDDLMRQIVLAQSWSPDRLRGFCRAIQKRLERGGGHG